MDKNAEPPGRVLGPPNEVRPLPLDGISLDQARAAANRIVFERGDVEKIGVAAFSSFI